MRKEERYKKLVAKIPESKGCKGCGQCCGPIPVESFELEILGQDAPGYDKKSLQCSNYENGKCKIYKNRFMICKLFGSVNHPKLTCPNGCRATMPLTYIQANKIVSEYKEMAKRYNKTTNPSVQEIKKLLYK